MSYQGNIDYMPVDDTDFSAEATEMMGQASIMNQAAGNKRVWLQSPTKSLFALWIFVVLLYLLLGHFFRAYRV